MPVMAGLGPAIHVFARRRQQTSKTWMPGVKPGMTESAMDDLIQTFNARGDLAHLALFLWASGASALAVFALRELAAAMRRFDDFVREIARFNERFRGQ